VIEGTGGFFGRRERCRGFSLLEILLVLVVLAIAAALTLPALVQPSGTQLRTAAGSFAAGLRRARNDAISSHREVLLSVNLDDKAFVIGSNERRQYVPKEISLSVFTARSEVLDERNAGIRFFPDGSSTGGRIALRFGDRGYRVDVDWLTGQVHVRLQSGTNVGDDAVGYADSHDSGAARATVRLQ
jgi:general secretion pathway protein H